MADLFWAAFQFLAGLGLFLFGLRYASDGLQKSAAGGLKRLVGSVTGNRFSALGVGVVATTLFQSSTACTVLMLSFVSAGLMNLGQGLGVALGSAVGTSLTIQLISLQFGNQALILVALGAALHLFSLSMRARNLGQVVFGAGLVFFGMGVMTGATAPIAALAGVSRAFAVLGEHPVLILILAAGVTAVVQSSAATLAIVMSLAGEGLVGSNVVLPVVLGAHIGGTLTALLTSLSISQLDARRVAIANTAFKVSAALVILPAVASLEPLLAAISGDIKRQIANGHTLVSLAMAVAFLPLLGPISRALNSLVPEREQRGNGLLKLDDRALEIPALALRQAGNAVLELGAIVDREMVRNLLPLLRHEQPDLGDRILAFEDRVDKSFKALNRYLSDLAQHNPTEEQSAEAIKLLYVINDLEHIGDVTVAICSLARKMSGEGWILTAEEWDELDGMHARICNDLSGAVAALESDDHQLAGRVIKGHPEVLRLEKTLRLNHFFRLQQCSPSTVEAGSQYLDLINYLLRIHDHVVSICQAILGIV